MRKGFKVDAFLEMKLRFFSWGPNELPKPYRSLSFAQVGREVTDVLTVVPLPDIPTLIPILETVVRL